MLSLIRLAALAGVLSLSVQGAVVLDGRQLQGTGPGPAVHSSACTDRTTVATATDNLPFPTDGSGVRPISTTEAPGHGRPLASKRAKVFSPPSFTHIPIGTVSAGSSDAGESCTAAEPNSTRTVGSTFTPGASAVPVQLSIQILTELFASHEVTLEGASATLTTSTAPPVDTHTVALRG